MPLPTRRAEPARWLLFQRRITVTDLARRLGMDRSYVSAILNGRSSGTPAFRRAVAELLDVPEDELFGPDQWQ